MKPTPPMFLVAVALVSGVLAWAVLRAVYSDLDRLPWTAIPTLLLLALGEGYTALATRARILRRPGTKPVDPLAVARLAALAKASAYAGAALTGIFGGFVIRVLGELEKQTPRYDAFVATGTFLSALALVAAALFLEYACRVPKDGSKDDELPPEPPPVHHA